MLAGIQFTLVTMWTILGSESCRHKYILQDFQSLFRASLKCGTVSVLFELVSLHVSTIFTIGNSQVKLRLSSKFDNEHALNVLLISQKYRFFYLFTFL